VRPIKTGGGDPFLLMIAVGSELTCQRPTELLRARQAAYRINKGIALRHTIEFRSAFVKIAFPVIKAFVVDLSLFIDAGPFGEIAVAPEHHP
jgi:hypothetical protein